MSAFFATRIVDVLFLFFNFQCSWIVNFLIVICLGVPVLPAFYGGLIEFSRIDTQKRAGRLIAPLMGTVIVIAIIFTLILRSLNNMLAVFGLGIPFYPFLRAIRTVVYLVTSSIFVFSAVIVRKYGLTTDFEEPESEVHRKWTVGGVMMMVGILLIFLGVGVAYVDPLALEGFVMTVPGLVLFPIGRVVWKRSKKTKLD